MIELVLTFIVAIGLFSLMAVGVLLGRRPIRGSCGGVGPDGRCATCNGDPNECENKSTDDKHNGVDRIKLI